MINKLDLMEWLETEILITQRYNVGSGFTRGELTVMRLLLHKVKLGHFDSAEAKDET